MYKRQQLTEDESTGTTEQQTEETAGDADGTRAVQDQADDVENSLEQMCIRDRGNIAQWGKP